MFRRWYMCGDPLYFVAVQGICSTFAPGMRDVQREVHVVLDGHTGIDSQLHY